MPVGYVYDTDSQTVMDSDEEVQIAVHNVLKLSDPAAVLMV